MKAIKFARIKYKVNGVWTKIIVSGEIEFLEWENTQEIIKDKKKNENT